MTDELKPCPFCGGKAELHMQNSTDPNSFWFIRCSNDECLIDTELDGRDVIIKCWNTRHNSDEIKRMRNLLEDVVNALDLSDSAIEMHGPLGTEPSELVKSVLRQKDMAITILKKLHESDTLPQWAIDAIKRLQDSVMDKSDGYFSGYIHATQDIMRLRNPEEKE